MHVIAGKAVAFKEAMSPKFKTYQRQIVKNAKELARALAKNNFRIVSGGTDTHLMLVDLNSKRITGKDASNVLGQVNITVNKNLIPFDKKDAGITSGIRIGTPAVTTRSLKEFHMRHIAKFINDAIEARDDPRELEGIKKEVIKLTKQFPLYPELVRNE